MQTLPNMLELRTQVRPFPLRLLLPHAKPMATVSRTCSEMSPNGLKMALSSVTTWATLLLKYLFMAVPILAFLMLMPVLVVLVATRICGEHPRQVLAPRLRLPSDFAAYVTNRNFPNYKPQAA